MKILETEVPNNIMEVYTLWLKHMELKECEQTLIMFLQDTFIANKWKSELPDSIRFNEKAMKGNEKLLAFLDSECYGRYLNQINLNNIKQQLTNESSRTNL